MPDPDASPCTGTCTLDREDVCLGCGRTIGEIIEWTGASAARRREIRASLPERLRARRG